MSRCNRSELQYSATDGAPFPRVSLGQLALLTLMSLSLACGDSKPDEDAKKATAEAGQDDVGTKDKAVEAPKPKKEKPKFSRGSLLPKGIILADVPVYNAAQGDPIEGEFTLEQAFADAPELADKSKGELTARITTNLGRFDCTLFEDNAPYTVASFVGLARGIRPFIDRKSHKWMKAPYFDRTVFHRVIRGFMIQGGDRTGSGRGSTGFVVRDEFSKELRHNRAGMMSMANTNTYKDGSNDLILDVKTKQPLGNTGSAQFFITVGPAPHLDDRHTVFGRCVPRIPLEISKIRVKTVAGTGIDHRPTRDVRIETVEILRKTPAPKKKSRRRKGKKKKK